MANEYVHIFILILDMQTYPCLTNLCVRTRAQPCVLKRDIVTELRATARQIYPLVSWTRSRQFHFLPLIENIDKGKTWTRAMKTTDERTARRDTRVKHDNLICSILVVEKNIRGRWIDRVAVWLEWICTERRRRHGHSSAIFRPVETRRVYRIFHCCCLPFPPSSNNTLNFCNSLTLSDGLSLPLREGEPSVTDLHLIILCST